MADGNQDVAISKKLKQSEVIFVLRVVRNLVSFWSLFCDHVHDRSCVVFFLK